MQSLYDAYAKLLMPRAASRRYRFGGDAPDGLEMSLIRSTFRLSRLIERSFDAVASRLARR